jgi:hypothetical protein
MSEAVEVGVSVHRENLFIVFMPIKRKFLKMVFSQIKSLQIPILRVFFFSKLITRTRLGCLRV